MQNGRVRWQPVIEPAHIVAAAGIGLAALLLVRAAKRRRACRNEAGSKECHCSPRVQQR